MENTQKKYSLSEFLGKGKKILSGAGNRGAKLTFINWENIKNQEMAFIIPLCPLYAPGNIDKSILLENPQSIIESRVVSKWNFIEDFLKTLASHEIFSGSKKTIHFVLADKGIITNQNNLEVILKKHSLVYQEAISLLASEYTQFDFEYTDYTQLEVVFAQSISKENYSVPVATHNPKVDEEMFVSYLKRILAVDNISYSFSHKKTIERTLRSFGMHLGAQLLASYIAPNDAFKMIAEGYPAAAIVNIERSDSILLQFPFFDAHQWQSHTAPTIAVSIKE